jgi:hypothetical protein
MLIDIKIVQTEVDMRPVDSISEGYISSFGILKVGDVIDSNSCHMRSIRPSHDLKDF